MMRLLITDVTLTKGHTLHADIRFTGGGQSHTTDGCYHCGPSHLPSHGFIRFMRSHAVPSSASRSFASRWVDVRPLNFVADPL
jgi:hypothetical protein